MLHSMTLHVVSVLEFRSSLFAKTFYNMLKLSCHVPNNNSSNFAFPGTYFLPVRECLVQSSEAVAVELDQLAEEVERGLERMGNMLSQNAP